MMSDKEARERIEAIEALPDRAQAELFACVVRAIGPANCAELMTKFLCPQCLRDVIEIVSGDAAPAGHGHLDEARPSSAVH